MFWSRSTYDVLEVWKNVVCLAMQEIMLVSFTRFLLQRKYPFCILSDDAENCALFLVITLKFFLRILRLRRIFFSIFAEYAYLFSEKVRRFLRIRSIRI